METKTCNTCGIEKEAKKFRKGRSKCNACAYQQQKARNNNACIECGTLIAGVSTKCNTCANKEKGEARTKLIKICPNCGGKKDRYSELCQPCRFVVMGEEKLPPKACVDCGTEISPTAKSRCRKCSAIHRVANITDEQRERISKKTTAQLHKRYAKMTDKERETLNRKISKSVRKRYEDEDYVERRAAGIEGWLKTRTSKVETKVAKELLPLGYEQGVRVGRYVVDFINNDTNTIVEVNGDYWHTNPEKYSPDYFHKGKGLTAKEIWEYDKERNEHLAQLGYKVVVIWEKEIKKDGFTINEYLE